jgi:hypothetical protein
VDWNTQRVVDENEPESGGTIKRDGKTLVTGKLTNPSLEAMLIILPVSATDDIRDELRDLVRDHLGDEVKFFELDYQPSQK